MWYAVILGGGSGQRMKAGKNKVLLDLCGIPILVRSLQAFQMLTDGMLVVMRREDMEEARRILDAWGFQNISIVEGGPTRQDSVYRGLLSLPRECDSVLIHDGARCLIDKDTILRCMQSTESVGCGVAAISVTDTIKKVDSAEQTIETPDRSALRAVQTPQAFRLQSLLEAHHAAIRDGFVGTDDASLLEHMGIPVQLVEGNTRNLKITRPEDLAVAASYLSMSSQPELHCGYGYDVHQLVAGRKLILCGIEVPHTLGLLGHSDADVALHALMDAMLGSVALGDIGHLFPDTDERYHGISSLKLLSAVKERLLKEHASVVNCDITIAAQKPKLAPYIQSMRETIADCLGLPVTSVSVKATTTEHLGFEGRMEGISASAVVMTKIC